MDYFGFTLRVVFFNDKCSWVRNPLVLMILAVNHHFFNDHLLGAKATGVFHSEASGNVFLLYKSW